MSPRPSRLACIDALKAISSQLIVLHHLAFYGPMSDAAYGLAPGLLDWLSEYARMAVQVFLVVSGFLAARSLAPGGLLQVRQPAAAVWRRYQKLVVPYAVAILIAVAGSALARAWMHHDSIPAAPHLMQFVAHLLLLHNLLDVDALSAGVWYVAIDMQLFALLVATLWLARGLTGKAFGIALVTVLSAASLFWFNRDAAFDVWAIYFFGAYGLGALAWWASQPGRPVMAVAALAALGGAALMVDFRERIVLALATALVLALARRGGWLEYWPGGRAGTWLWTYFGKISYSVFLVHFPVCLVVNALVSHFAPGDPVLNALGMVAAWTASNLAGAAFYRYVESADLAGAARALGAVLLSRWRASTL